MSFCKRCGIHAPFHHPTCADRGNGPVKTLGESLRAVGLELLAEEPERDALPGRDAREAFEVTQTSRFGDES